MSKFQRNDFGSNPNAGANRNNAASRGWGPGWPSNNAHKMGLAKGGGVQVYVRKEVVDLVETLLDVTVALGYRLDRIEDDWGYANRAIRGTRTPSNHSWGLAVDLNSTVNPMSSNFVTDIPPAVVKAWESCGWYWGGRYENRPDTMHFEYIGRPRDVAKDLAEAKALRSKPVRPAVVVKPTVFKPGARTVSQGDEGPDVAFLQRWLGVVPDSGEFGPKTLLAVKKYQNMQDLEVDGIVGKQTWKVILGG